MAFILKFLSHLSYLPTKIDFMKSTLYLLLFTAMGLISCSENEQPPEEASSLVVGEWNIEEINFTGTSTVTEGGQSLTCEYTGHASAMEMTMIYDSDNNYSIQGKYNIMVITILNGDTNSDLQVYPHISTTGTYSIQENILVTTANWSPGKDPVYPLASFEGAIKELTLNKMVLFIEKQESSIVNGTQIENNYQMTQIFSR